VFDNHLPGRDNVRETVYTSFITAWGGANFNNLWTANDDLALIGKLRTAVAGSDFNLGVFLGEGHEALKMIATNATKIYRAYKLARKGNFIGAAEQLVRGSGKRGSVRSIPAKNWLELQYGWLPLLKDVKGGAEFLAHQLNTPLHVTVKVRHKVEAYPVRSLNGNAVYTFGWHRSTGQIIYRAKEIDVPQLVGLTDPASVAWELLPFSFVADWFLPIGSWLDARGLSQALTGTFVTTHGQDGFATQPNSTHPNYQWAADSQERWRTVDRQVTNNLLVPFPNIKPLGKIATWKHAVNSIALLAAPNFRNRLSGVW